MRIITATEASRNFSYLLDAVENGEEVVILRGKKEVARMVPVDTTKPNGAALLSAVSAWQNSNPGDADPESWSIYSEMKNDPINQIVDPWEE